MVDLSLTADLVAPGLLGSVLRCGDVAVRLTEVEAYLGMDDPASHAWRGPTRRTAVMFGPPGHLYVYLSYGMHLAANIVCGADGSASACLLRGGEIVHGVGVARERRGDVPDERLARGPGNLGQALGLGLTDSGAVIGGPGDRFQIVSTPSTVLDHRTGRRVGISRNVDAPLRFWLPGAVGVSGRRAADR